jgi:DNA-directed RNA polymerase specialized sigma24 family protein
MEDMMLLVEPLIPALRRYVRALVRDRAMADDLVQDCLERTISHWHQRRPDGDARTWHPLADEVRRQVERKA